MNNSFFFNLSHLFFRHGRVVTFVLFVFLFLLTVSLIPNGIYYWDFFCIIAIILFPWYKYLDKSGKWLLIWELSFGSLLIITNGAYSGTSIILYFLAPILFYAIGGWFVDKLKCNEKELIILVLITIVSISIVLWYRALLDISINGFITGLRFFEIEGVEEVSSTLYGLYAAIAMVGIPLFFTTNKSWKSLVMWSFLFMALLSTTTTIHLVNRTALVVLVLCSIFVIIYRSKAKVYKIVFYLVLFAFAFYLIIKLGIISDDILSVYEIRNNDSGVGTAGGRTYRWIDALSRVFYMPFGWYGKDSLTGYNYAHNWWLDVGRQTGLLPFIALVVPTVISFKTLLKLFSLKENLFVALLIGLNVCLFAAAFVEPVMEGSPFFAYYYIFIWGLQNRYLKQRTISVNSHRMV